MKYDYLIREDVNADPQRQYEEIISHAKRGWRLVSVVALPIEKQHDWQDDHYVRYYFEKETVEVDN
jgi:hypothetical protein